MQTTIAPAPVALVRDDAPDPVARLTAREREILALIAAGHSNDAIRQLAYISPKTLERHVHNLFCKLDLPNDSAINRRVRAAILWWDSPLRHAQRPVFSVVGQEPAGAAA